MLETLKYILNDIICQITVDGTVFPKKLRVSVQRSIFASQKSEQPPTNAYAAVIEIDNERIVALGIGVRLHSNTPVPSVPN